MAKNNQGAAARALASKTLAAEKAGPRFYSIDGEPVHVALPDGRKAVVTEEPRSLPQAMWKAALAAGCATDQRVNAQMLARKPQEAASDQGQRRALIEKAIDEALNAEEGAAGFEDAFLPTGSVNMKWLNGRVGFQVERSERDEAMRRIEAQLERDKEEGDQDADENDVNQETAAAAARKARG